jgi:hypothetical protein
MDKAVRSWRIHYSEGGSVLKKWAWAIGGFSPDTSSLLLSSSIKTINN